MSLKFLTSYLKRPGEIGAVWPSSPDLCKVLSDGFDWQSARYVVEYGPGTGVVSPFIMDRLHPAAKFFAIEKNPSFCQILLRKFPELDLQEGSAEDVVELCRERKFPHLDVVLSGLPWAAFPDSLQDALMKATLAALRPGGQFATFAYSHFLFLPAARKFRMRLDDSFSEVVVTKTVWKNMPPAIVYRCRR